MSARMLHALRAGGPLFSSFVGCSTLQDHTQTWSILFNIIVLNYCFFSYTYSLISACIHMIFFCIKSAMHCDLDPIKMYTKHFIWTVAWVDLTYKRGSRPAVHTGAATSGGVLHQNVTRWDHQCKYIHTTDFKEATSIMYTFSYYYQFEVA